MPFLSVKEKYATIKAFIFKGTVANIAALPAIADQKPGYVYNVTKGGTTTADFDIGAGHPLRDGDNVVAINNGTDAVPIMKWDILGATFIIEDRLQFGDTFPSEPENDQTFLYMGDTTYTYTNVSATLTPSDNPSTASYFEYDEVNNEYNPSADLYVDESKTYYTIASDTPTSDPQAEGFYELDGTKYVASTDTTVDSGKTYYKASIATVVRGEEKQKYSGSKVANTSAMIGSGVVLNFTDSNVWNMLKTGLGEDVSKKARKFPIDLENMITVPLWNGYETVEVPCLLFDANTYEDVDAARVREGGESAE